jgi:nucleoside-triphosphatase
MPDIYILTGAIGSGKTTALLHWSENHKDVYGILTPVVNGERVFMDAHNRRQFKMEASAMEENTLDVGRWKFDRGSFDKAVEILSDACNREGWVVVDELGPLELRKEGLYEIVEEMIHSTHLKILLVVRDTLLEKMIDHFQLQQYHPVILMDASPFFR